MAAGREPQPACCRRHLTRSTFHVRLLISCPRCSTCTQGSARGAWGAAARALSEVHMRIEAANKSAAAGLLFCSQRLPCPAQTAEAASRGPACSAHLPQEVERQRPAARGPRLQPLRQLRHARQRVAAHRHDQRAVCAGAGREALARAGVGGPAGAATACTGRLGWTCRHKAPPPPAGTRPQPHPHLGLQQCPLSRPSPSSAGSSPAACPRPAGPPSVAGARGEGCW